MSEREQNSVFANPPAAQPGMPVQSTKDQVKKDFDLEIPVEYVPLPSRGKTYAVGSSLHGENLVGITAMTAHHENILANRALHKKGTVVTELLKSVIVDKSVDVRNLLSGDRNALMVSLRALSYGHDYSVMFECPNPECEIKSEINIDLQKVGIKYLELEPVTPGQNEFSFMLPRLNKEVRFKFLTGKDEEDISQTAEQMKKLGLQVSNETVTRGLHYSLVSVDGITDRAKLLNFAKMISAFDSSALRRHIRDNEPGLDMHQDVTCPSCGHVEGKVGIELTAEFFWPGSLTK